MAGLEARQADMLRDLETKDAHIRDLEQALEKDRISLQEALEQALEQARATPGDGNGSVGEQEIGSVEEGRSTEEIGNFQESNSGKESGSIKESSSVHPGGDGESQCRAHQGLCQGTRA